MDGKPALLCHASVGFAHGTVRGGHMLNTFVFPRFEIFAVDGAVPVYTHWDAQTTLDLFDLTRP